MCSIPNTLMPIYLGICEGIRFAFCAVCRCFHHSPSSSNAQSTFTISRREPTYLSNYSPEVVPDARTHYSILAEVSCSDYKPEDPDFIVDQVIQGLVNTKMISAADREHIVDTHVIERDYTYPIPSLERDTALAAIHPFLESRSIYSRGRFGAWRYEVGNMDHSVAQGVEWVNRIVRGDVKNELTYQAKRGC